MADFVREYERFEEAGVRVLAISVDEPGKRDAVGEFAAEFGVPFPVLFADDQVVNAYTVLQHNLFDRRSDLAIPTSFLLDERGDVVRVYRGETTADAILSGLDEDASAALPFSGRWIRSEPSRNFAALGAAYAERGLAVPAIAAFERAIESGKATAELSNNLAGALLQAGEWERAEALLRQSLSTDPNDLDATLNLATLLLQRGGEDEARRLAQKVADARPDDGSAWTLLASAELAQGRVEAAETHYQKALDIDRSAPGTYDGLGALQASTGRFDEAIRSYEEAVRLGADSAQLHSNLGALYMQTGSPARGLLAFKRAAVLSPEDYGVQLNLALYYSQTGSLRQASEAAERAREADPKRVEAYWIGAQASAGLGDRETARSLLEKLLVINPQDADAQKLLEQLGQ